MSAETFTDSETNEIRGNAMKLTKSTCTDEITHNAKKLAALCRGVIVPGDIHKVKQLVVSSLTAGMAPDAFGFNPFAMALRTAVALCERVAVDRTLVLAVILNSLSCDECVRDDFGEDVATALERLHKVKELSDRHLMAENENFKRLLLTFAEDIRIIILMITERLVLMEAINHHPDESLVKRIAEQARYLYAPLAHRLGLYGIKSELEDMSMKYTEREVYTKIAKRLNETKTARQQYIDAFIEPVRKRLEAECLKFEIKGRTKSISSIWNKIKKQRVDIDGIYDLFAIRIILDSPADREKQQCWLAYSIVTDMFRPNPARTKDWISIPKANGYESLHTTVYGPGDRWVEVQIRTARMDEIAEKGLAAHWKYKGIKAETHLDEWMGKVRDILETAESGPMNLMKNMKMDVYDHEVFVFTPKGDLFNLPAGATLLDFAFHIHTGVGASCTGGRVNGKVRKLNYRLESGDTVEIMTSAAQQPKPGWLDIVVTSKARNKIRAALKEQALSAAQYGKELLQRRLKNRKIEISEADMTKLIKRAGFRNATEFFCSLGDGSLDIGQVFNYYDELTHPAAAVAATGADRYVMHNGTESEGITADPENSAEILVIGDNIKGINYRLARCCNPVYGDDTFGFVSAEGVVKIHRTDCPNAANIRSKYPYRVIRTRWSGTYGGQLAVTLRIVGNDDIGIVTNITSIINKENGATLRNISVDSDTTGLFSGYLVVGVSDSTTLNNLMKKLRTVKGVKDVSRAI